MQKSEYNGSDSALLNALKNDFDELPTSKNQRGIHKKVQTGLRAGTNLNVQAKQQKSKSIF